MTAGQILSLPGAAAGLTPAGNATAWLYGAWVEASASLATNILVLGITFQVEHILELDTTLEMMIEIGTGAGGSEATKVQIPYSYRMDTAVGYYMISPKTIYLPEPMRIASGTRVAVRATDNHAAALTYTGVKIIYQEI
jgi:hypothetical protein